MICVECEKEMDMFVSIRLKLPSKYENHITKKVISSKDCEIIYADWDKASFICKECSIRKGYIRSK